MKFVPRDIDYLTAAASAAAKARSVVPVERTYNPHDVATAMKCMTLFQTLETIEELRGLDDEAKAAPLIAAARTLMSTSEQLANDLNSTKFEVDDLRFHAAAAYAMQGNFPSARAALIGVSEQYLAASAVRLMLSYVCDPCRTPQAELLYQASSLESFAHYWRGSLREMRLQQRKTNFSIALSTLEHTATSGSMEDLGLLLFARVGALQAQRLAMVNLLEEAPEIPSWLVKNAIDMGMFTLLPPQRKLLVEGRIAANTRNTLLTLPTSTGKTFLAEACMVASVMDGGLTGR